MFYKDGKTEPEKGDTVMGDKFKGMVKTVLKDKVVIAARAPYDPKRPDDHKMVEVEKDPAELQLVYRP